MNRLRSLLFGEKLTANSVVAIILLLAITGIGFSVYQLQQIFLSENERSRLLLEDRRNYIEKAAGQLFADALHRKLEVAVVKMHELAKKPYIQSEDFFWSKGQEQIIPLAWQFSQLPADNVMSYYSQLCNVIEQATEGEDWQEDLLLLWRFRQAVEQQNEKDIESIAREIMNYDANHRFAPRHELVYRLVFIENLAGYPQASRELLAKLIRDDLADDRGTVLTGLQKSVLWRRNDLSREEFKFLAGKVATLSKSVEVPSDDFLQATNPHESEKPVGPVVMINEAMLLNGSWFYDREGQNIYGVKVDINSIRQDVTAVLMEQQWLAAGESLSLLPEAAAVKISDVRFNWSSSTYQENLAELQRFYRLKQTILIASLLGFLAVGFLIWWLYRRQARWVGIKSEFVAAVAHEMRTPLSGIRLMAEQLGKSLQGEPKAKDYPQRILADIDTLSFLSENILSFERLQSGQWVAHTSPVSLTEVLEELRSELPLFVKKQFVITKSSKTDVVIQADPVLVKLLFLNLAKNSCAYNEHSVAEIDVRWSLRGEDVLVDITDNGVGIEKEEWQDCFVPFYRGKSQRHTRGSGLGLALCQKIMTLHKGDMKIVNSSKSGTHFRLNFPAQAVAVKLSDC